MSTPTQIRTFEDLGVDSAVVAALADAGITAPFPIQELSLPMALSGADLIGQARTGTGKTLAFGIPLIQRVDPTAGHTQALVVVPTRELCLQVHEDLRTAGARRDVQVVAAYGGRSIDPQSEAIAAGAPIVVGTPGRLLDLCRRRLLDLSRVTALVLDEADEMLDMGFLPDVEQLIERCPDERQTLLFSATMPSEVVRLARRYMDKPTFMRTDVEQQQHVAPRTHQHFFACHRLDKPAVVARILGAPGRGRTLIFTRTKRMADVLASELRDRGIKAGIIHSDLRQEARERALAKFRKGTVDVLCATEVAARGLDIDEVTHVINYDCPDDERMYLHRIGRTGRAGAAGVAITLAVWNELARLDMIKRALDIDQPTHEVLSTSPMLDDLFGAADARGRRAPKDDIATDATESRGTARAGTQSPRTDRRPRSRRRRRRRVETSTPQTAGTTDGGGAPPETAGTRATATESAPTEAVTRDGDAVAMGAGEGDARDAATSDGTAATTSTDDGTGTRDDTDTPDGAGTPTADREDGPRTSKKRSRGGRRRSSRGGRRSGRTDARRPGDEESRQTQRDGATARQPAGRDLGGQEGGGQEGGGQAGGGQDGGGQEGGDGDHLRGGGRPTLNRPLHITHLP